MILRILLAVLISATPGLAQTSRPATVAEQRDYLDEGRFLFNPPADWSEAFRSPDGMAVQFNAPEGRAALQVMLVPQETVLSPTMKGRVAKFVIEGKVAGAKDRGVEVIDAPKAVKDDRFYLKIRDRIRKPDGGVEDRLHVYRVMGAYLLLGACTAFTDDEPAAALSHKVAEDVLLSATGGRKGKLPTTGPSTAAATQPAKLTLLPKAKLRIQPPPGWKQELSDGPSGQVGVWKDPGDGATLILLGVRQIPIKARKDKALREIAIQEIVSAERPTLEMAGAKLIDAPVTVPDDRFLRKIETRYDLDGEEWRVSLRQRLVGDAVLVLTSVTSSDKADAVGKLGDEMLISAQSTVR